MDIITGIVTEIVVVVGTFVCKCIYPKIENIVYFSSNVEILTKEMEKLGEIRDDIKGKVEVAEGEGYKPKHNVVKWIEDVCELEKEWDDTMKESIAAAKKLVYKCCPNCSLRSQVSTKAKNIRDKLSTLQKDGKDLGPNLMDQVKRVEFIPGPSIEGQPAATRNLNKIMKLLEDDKVCIISIRGAGGIGKTTLVKNLNNKLLQIDVSRSKLYFGVVIWVTMPKPTGISNVQAKIANRLNLKVDNEGSVESNAGKIYERLKQEESFLLILDDVWKDIDLDHVGVPQPEYPTRSKVIITSRSWDVCRKMKAREETDMMVCTLNEDESWKLFVKNARDVANLEDIKPLAKEITRECDGLPLAITVIGASMRGKKRVELWKDTLKSLRMSEPYTDDVKDKVYKVIKWSFDFLVSQDIESSSEQRGKLVNKKSGDIQSCFLYCSLYPEAISTDDLIHCWWAEGFLGEHNTYEEAYNRGITMIDSLEDVCLLEAHWLESVKMHDVVRHVAKWIAKSFGDEHNSVIQAGMGLTEISHIEVSSSVKRISFVSNKIESLPNCLIECPETTSLLLLDNSRLEKISHEIFLAFRALRVLNLSETGIRALPFSINSLCTLRALILRSCHMLKKLPPIGTLCNLQVLDCNDTRLRCLPKPKDKLINLRLLNLPNADLKSISKGFFLKLSSIEMLNMKGSCVGSTSFDELSRLNNLTSLCIRLDSSSIFNRGDHTWMTRLKKFHIEIGETTFDVPFNKSARMIGIFKCEIFSNGELSGMLRFASDLYLEECMGLSKLFANNSFDQLESLHIQKCSCDFRQVEEGSGQCDPLPNLKYLRLYSVCNLKSVSDFSQLLGLRSSTLRQLDIQNCASLTCLFNVGGAFSVPKHLEDISIGYCGQLVELFVQCSSSDQATLVDSEIPRVQKLNLRNLPKLGTLGEPQSMWEHLEELEVMWCNQLRKLPHSIQTSNNIKVIKGESEWWSQLEWDDDNYKTKLEHCFTAIQENNILPYGSIFQHYQYPVFATEEHPNACTIS